ncbi:MAG: hypothetical protein QNJ33_17995 [Crocosphaera sp.]|nr:hypothetical protein [Crocosphaera sp.]
MMKQKIFRLLFTLLLSCCLMNVSDTLAATETGEVNVSLGNEAGELIFVPNHLEFVVGKKYKINLNNPSPIKHFISID